MVAGVEILINRNATVGQMAGICGRFPRLDPETGAGYRPAARRTLRPLKGRLLQVTGRAA